MNLEELKVKAKRDMVISIVLLVGFFAYCIGVQGEALQRMDFDSPVQLVGFLSNIVLTAMVIAANVNAVLMFRLLKKSETPFQMAIVKKLRIISGLLIAFEPVQIVFTWIVNGLSPEIKTHSSLGGMVLIIGSVVACVSIAFEYGVVLQTQADETL